MFTRLSAVAAILPACVRLVGNGNGGVRALANTEVSAGRGASPTQGYQPCPIPGWLTHQLSRQEITMEQTTLKPMARTISADLARATSFALPTVATANATPSDGNGADPRHQAGLRNRVGG